MKLGDDIVLSFGKDGSIIGRRPFGDGTIAMMRLQFRVAGNMLYN